MAFPSPPTPPFPLEAERFLGCHSLTPASCWLKYSTPPTRKRKPPQKEKSSVYYPAELLISPNSTFCSAPLSRSSLNLSATFLHRPRLSRADGSSTLHPDTALLRISMLVPKHGVRLWPPCPAGAWGSQNHRKSLCSGHSSQATAAPPVRPHPETPTPLLGRNTGRLPSPIGAGLCI